MAVFRVERNKGYTVMSNHHLRNKELSLKAKGLLSQMLSLPEDWDYTLAGLSHTNREISASIILQSQSQLKVIYKDNADTVVGNCDTTLFLGGKEKPPSKKYRKSWGKKRLTALTPRKHADESCPTV